MRKDYVPVSEALSTKDEAAFVEEYWSRMWVGRQIPEQVKAQLKRREEFRIMDPYLSRLPAKSRILDGGCGLGEWTVYYASKGFEVVGLDLSRATIERLKARFPDQQFVVGDVRETGFPEASFDAYFSWGTFEHFEEGLGRCFREARRILKPGGYLFISVPFQNARHLWRDQRELWRWDESFDPSQGYPSPMRFYQWRLTKPELQRELELHGFRTLRVEPMHKDQGLRRALQHDWRLPAESLVHRAIRRALAPVITKAAIGHMIMAVGQKRNGRIVESRDGQG